MRDLLGREASCQPGVDCLSQGVSARLVETGEELYRTIRTEWYETSEGAWGGWDRMFEPYLERGIRWLKRPTLLWEEEQVVTPGPPVVTSAKNYFVYGRFSV